MASAKKHMERSHRSYHTAKPFSTFENKAVKKAEQKEKKNFFSKLFHRTTNK